jgi:hypothetical protein
VIYRFATFFIGAKTICASSKTVVVQHHYEWRHDGCAQGFPIETAVIHFEINAKERKIPLVLE